MKAGKIDLILFTILTFYFFLFCCDYKCVMITALTKEDFLEFISFQKIKLLIFDNEHIQALTEENFILAAKNGDDEKLKKYRFVPDFNFNVQREIKNNRGETHLYTSANLH